MTDTSLAPVDEGVAASYLGIARSTLKRLRLHGKGPDFIRIGGAIRYDHAALDAYRTARTNLSNPARPE